MKRLVRFAVLASVFGCSTAHAGPITLIGAGVLVPADRGAARADWSSMFGNDYVATTDGVGNFGNAITTNPWAVIIGGGGWHTDETVEVLVDTGAPVGAGYIRSEGTMTVGAGGAVAPSIVHSIATENVLYNPVFGIGMGSSTGMAERFSFSGVSAASPLYWVAEWDVRVVNGGSNSPLGWELALTMDGVPMLSMTGPLIATQALSGSASVSTLNSSPIFKGDTVLGGANMLGESLLALDMRIAFWDQPFASIPRAPAVPEPATWMMLVPALGFVVRRATGRG